MKLWIGFYKEEGKWIPFTVDTSFKAVQRTLPIDGQTKIQLYEPVGKKK